METSETDLTETKRSYTKPRRWLWRSLWVMGACLTIAILAIGTGLFPSTGIIDDATFSRSLHAGMTQGEVDALKIATHADPGGTMNGSTIAYGDMLKSNPNAQFVWFSNTAGFCMETSAVYDLIFNSNHRLVHWTRERVFDGC